jgi:proteasome alpha subunit
MAYDRTIVVFSPDGRLLQVEYARQMVKNGTTSVGLVTRDSVVFGSVKVSTPLVVLDSYRKTYQIDKHVTICSAGSLADARDLVDIARIKAQVNRITYNQPISVHSLTKYIVDRKHMVTQYAGVRPYGVGLLIGGVDETGSRLFETDPSGTMIEWKAQAIGRGAEKARKLLIRDYKESIDERAGLKLLLKALKIGEKDAQPENLEVVVQKKSQIKKLSPKEISAVI